MRRGGCGEGHFLKAPGHHLRPMGAATGQGFLVIITQLIAVCWLSWTKAIRSGPSPTFTTLPTPQHTAAHGSTRQHQDELLLRALQWESDSLKISLKAFSAMILSLIYAAVTPRSWNGEAGCANPKRVFRSSRVGDPFLAPVRYRINRYHDESQQLYAR